MLSGQAYCNPPRRIHRYLLYSWRLCRFLAEFGDWNGEFLQRELLSQDHCWLLNVMCRNICKTPSALCNRAVFINRCQTGASHQSPAPSLLPCWNQSACWGWTVFDTLRGQPCLTLHYTWCLVRFAVVGFEFLWPCAPENRRFQHPATGEVFLDNHCQKQLICLVRVEEKCGIHLQTIAQWTLLFIWFHRLEKSTGQDRESKDLVTGRLNQSHGLSGTEATSTGVG